MKVNIFTSLLIGLLAVCTGEKDTKENKDSKDKRQIGIHQTRINPHDQIPDSEHLETVYGSHPSQFVIRAVGQGQPHLQYQPQQQIAPQPEQLQEQLGPQKYSYVPEAVQVQQGKTANHPKQFPKKTQHPRPVQYIQETQQFTNQYQDQPYPSISQEQILRLLQEELGQHDRNVEEKQVPQKSYKAPFQVNNQKQGLGNYREAPSPSGNAALYYTPQNIPQQYYSQVPIDYHRSVPDHPLAASSLEKELEKLVASNKPSPQYRQQDQIYKTTKTQPKLYATTPAPEDKPFSFFSDFAQFSGFNQPQVSYLDQQVLSQKVSPHQGQYLSEVTQPKQKIKTNSATYQQKPQFYSSQQKSPSQYVPVTEHNKNSAVKIISAPALQYEKPRVAAQTPAANLYYRNSAAEAQTQSHIEPSRSAIYVSQGTGVQPTTQPSQSQQTKSFSDDKLSRLLSQDSKPITQEEFQALVDAGYPVQAVPVPVPVPYEKYVTEQRPEYRQATEESDSGLRRINEGRQGITYLHPVVLQQEREKLQGQNASS